MENVFTLFFLLLQLILLSLLLIVARVAGMAKPVFKVVISIFKPGLKVTEYSF